MTESAQQRAKKPVSACVSASGSASSPVCRINEKLANTAFASFVFCKKCVLVFVWSLFLPNDTKRIATIRSICAVCAYDTLVAFDAYFVAYFPKYVVCPGVLLSGNCFLCR